MGWSKCIKPDNEKLFICYIWVVKKSERFGDRDEIKLSNSKAWSSTLGPIRKSAIKRKPFTCVKRTQKGR